MRTRHHRNLGIEEPSHCGESVTTRTGVSLSQGFSPNRCHVSEEPWNLRKQFQNLPIRWSAGGFVSSLHNQRSHGDDAAEERSVHGPQGIGHGMRRRWGRRIDMVSNKDMVTGSGNIVAQKRRKPYWWVGDEMAVLDGQLKELDRLRKEQEQVIRKINVIHSKLQQVGEESQNLSLNCSSICLFETVIFRGEPKQGRGQGFVWFCSRGFFLIVWMRACFWRRWRSSNAMVNRELEGFV